jgi:hypothetical protein
MKNLRKLLSLLLLVFQYPHHGLNYVVALFDDLQQLLVVFQNHVPEALNHQRVFVFEFFVKGPLRDTQFRGKGIHCDVPHPEGEEQLTGFSENFFFCFHNFLRIESGLQN